MVNEYELRKDIIRFGKLCWERRFLVALDGNLSVRLPSGDVLCTRSGAHKGMLSDDDLLLVDATGRVKRGEGRPTSEILMHLACYAERPDVKAVIHAHPPLCVAFTIAGVSMARCVLPEVVLTLGVVPTVPYATTGTQALADIIRAHVTDFDAVLMDTHGTLTVGCDLLEAFCRLETLEHTAQIMKTAHALGGIRNLPPEEAVRLRKLGLTRYGGPPAAVQRVDAPCADLPICEPATPSFAHLVDGGAKPLRAVRLSAAPLRPFPGESAASAAEGHQAAGQQEAEAHLTALVVDEVVRALALGRQER